MVNRIVVFGTGRYYRNRKEMLNNEKIVAFIDNSAEKQGTVIDGVAVLSPSELELLDYDFVLLMSLEQESMKEQLILQGIPESKILDYEVFIKKISRYKIEIYSKKTSFFSNNKKHILIISNDLNYSGAPIACVYACLALKQKGFDVALLSDKGSESFIEEVINRGITVFIYRNILSCDTEDIWFLKFFDHIIINTYQMLPVIESAASYSRPVLWIHEAEMFYPPIIDKHDNELLNRAVVKIVSPVAMGHFKKRFPDIDASLLSYGIEDENKTLRENGFGLCDNKIRIGIIGDACFRKGQLKFIQALENLSDVYLARVIVILVGVISDDDYGSKLKQKISEVNFVEYAGRKHRNEMEDVFNKIDVVAVPSEDDPLPIVATEGMMYRKVCFVSDKTGTAEYINDKENGLIFRYGDDEDVRRQIVWLLDNIDKYEEIATNSRKVYETHFSMEYFGDNLEKTFELNN